MADGTLYRVGSEADAWHLLKDALEQKIDPGDKPAFAWKGWPILRIDLPNTPISGSISPSMMEGFLKYQDSIFRSHALLSSGNESLRGVNRFEKERLEFRVRVEKGSSLYSIDLQQIIERLGTDVVAKMNGTELVITVLGLAVIVAGTVVWTRILDQRTDQRRVDSDDADTRAMLDSFKAHLDHDTKRYEMLTRAITNQPILKKVEEANEPAREAIIDAVADEDGGDIQGIALSGPVAREMSIRPRQTSTEVNLSRVYRVSKVDTTVPDGFRVTLLDIQTGDELAASLLDMFVSLKHRELLQEAEWRKKPVKVSLTGRRLRGQIVDAKITGVDEVKSS